MNKFTSAVQAFIADEDGLTAIEYGLMAAGIGTLLLAGAQALGGGLKEAFTQIGTFLTSNTTFSSGGGAAGG